MQKNIVKMSEVQTTTMSGIITLFVTVTAILITADAFIGSIFLNLNGVLILNKLVTLFCLLAILLSSIYIGKWTVYFVELKEYNWKVLISLINIEVGEDEKLSDRDSLPEKMEFLAKKAKKSGESFGRIIIGHTILFAIANAVYLFGYLLFA